MQGATRAAPCGRPRVTVLEPRPEGSGARRSRLARSRSAQRAQCRQRAGSTTFASQRMVAREPVEDVVPPATSTFASRREQHTSWKNGQRHPPCSTCPRGTGVPPVATFFYASSAMRTTCRSGCASPCDGLRHSVFPCLSCHHLRLSKGDALTGPSVPHAGVAPAATARGTGPDAADATDGRPNSTTFASRRERQTSLKNGQGHPPCSTRACGTGVPPVATHFYCVRKMVGFASFNRAGSHYLPGTSAATRTAESEPPRSSEAESRAA